MTDLRIKYGTPGTFTKTNANLATSATAGWVSNAITNSNAALDALVSFELAAVNTAPANSKGIFVFAYGLIDGTGTAYTSSGAATPGGGEGTLTYPDVTANIVTMPRIGFIPYTTQNVAINAGPFSVAQAFGNGILPYKWGIGIVNHSGMTLNVSNIRYVEIFNELV